jgi:predicted nucleic acid-binding protein
MTVVLDASVMVAALIDSGPHGLWAEGFLSSHLAAPHLLPVEVASVLRRAMNAGAISADLASLAHADLAELHVELVDYDLVAPRIWELRRNLTPYDACYVAVAELLGAPLATLDRRLVNSPGPTCQFLTPSA